MRPANPRPRRSPNSTAGSKPSRHRGAADPASLTPAETGVALRAPREWTPAGAPGTHPDHRGHGYGRDAVLGACAALANRGAGAVAVMTPSTNDAAVALYRSAGFTVVRETRAWVRAPPA